MRRRTFITLLGGRRLPRVVWNETPRTITTDRSPGAGGRQHRDRFRGPLAQQFTKTQTLHRREMRTKRRNCPSTPGVLHCCHN